MTTTVTLYLTPMVVQDFDLNVSSPSMASTPIWAILVTYVNDLFPCSKMFQYIALGNYCVMMLC